LKSLTTIITPRIRNRTAAKKWRYEYRYCIGIQFPLTYTINMIVSAAGRIYPHTLLKKRIGRLIILYNICNCSGSIALTGFAPQFDRLTAAPKSPAGGL
jgi:hypothetical protein